MGTASALPTELTVPQKSPLFQRMAEQYQMVPSSFVETIIKTCFPQDPNKPPPTLAQVAMFLSVAHQYQLNPFTREIFAFVTKSGGIIPIVSVDGWVSLVTRHKQYDGADFKYEMNGDKPVSVTCAIHRKNVQHSPPATEFFIECVRNNDIWTKWPRRMLRHKAYIQAARMAFGFSGIYDEDEGQRILEGDVVPEVKTAIPLPEREIMTLESPQPLQAQDQNQTQEIPQAEIDSWDFKLQAPETPVVQISDFIDQKQIVKLMTVARAGRFHGKTSTMVEEEVRKHCHVESLLQIRKEDYPDLMIWAGGDRLKMT